MTSPEELEGLVESYCNARTLIVESCLGAGTQGSVFVVTNSIKNIRHAVKFHERAVAFDRERDVYLRLKELEIDYVCGHRIPVLVAYDNELLAIEMTIVSPPFCLDFGGAYLDHRPDYSPEVWADWRKQKSEAFESNWPIVEKIISEFEQYGIYIADVNPGNIRY
jgi:hypothetical protein